jgi:acetyltransferase-like isoleucine patch superfamily enzyme
MSHSRQLRAKRLRNGLYVWIIHVVHLVLDLLPGPIRAAAWRPLLGACGKRLMVDHRVYFKYPWLISIGDDVSINRGASFFPGMLCRATITIGNGVRIAPNVSLCAAGHDPDDPDLVDVASPIMVEDGAWLGAGCILLPGARIGPGAVVAAGAVVRGEVPAGAIVAGVPARLIRMRKGTAA